MQETTPGEYVEVKLEERIGVPDAWTVEAYDTEGGVEQAIFIGPKAQERAEEYARNRYGWKA